MSDGVEFVCCECNIPIVSMIGPVPTPPLCAMCLMMPGWHQLPAVRDLHGRGFEDLLPPILPKDVQ